MRLKLLSLFVCIVFASAAGATTLTITVQDFKFTPSDATINLGDTIIYTWINGSHTTTSTTIPGGAVAWDHPINASSTSFTYVPAVAGVYNYKCTPHAAMGHIGKFTVNSGTGIASYDFSKIVFDLYPNPAKGMLNITLKDNNQQPVQVSIADISGRQLLEAGNTRGSEVQMNIGTLTPGIYFVRVVRDGRIYVRKFSVEL